MYKSTKVWPYAFSCAFRQWRAESHCRFIHGYAFTVKLTFVANELDERNWVVDFGSLKSFKQQLEDTFDHKTVVATDDPEYNRLNDLCIAGVIDMVEVEHTGCEQFAKLIFEGANIWLKDNGFAPRCWVESVELNEHPSNSAIYAGDPTKFIFAEVDKRISTAIARQPDTLRLGR